MRGSFATNLYIRVAAHNRRACSSICGWSSSNLGSCGRCLKGRERVVAKSARSSGSDDNMARHGRTSGMTERAALRASPSAMVPISRRPPLVLMAAVRRPKASRLSDGTQTTCTASWATPSLGLPPLGARRTTAFCASIATGSMPTPLRCRESMVRRPARARSTGGRVAHRAWRRSGTAPNNSFTISWVARSG